MPLVAELLAPLYRGVLSLKTYKQRKRRGQQLIRKLASLGNDTPRIWFFCPPPHANLGDRAQWLCILNWLAKNYPRHEIIEIDRMGFNFYEKIILPKLQRLINKQDIILFQSGYHFTGTSNNENVYNKIVNTFTDNQIIFMPLTFNFKNERLKERTKQRYNKHSKTVFLVRDKESFVIAKEMFGEQKILLCPDIVTCLIGKYAFTFPRDKILFCLRNDSEQYYTKSDINTVISCFSGQMPCDVSDTFVTQASSSLSEKEYYTKQINDLIERFAHYKCIVTDRFHGTIFSLAANTPVVILKTKDHKVTSGATWFTDVYAGFVYQTNDLDEAKIAIQTIINHPPTQPLADYFEQQYYVTLKARIHEKLVEHL